MRHARVTQQQLIEYAAGELTGAAAEQVRAHLQRKAAAARTVNLFRLAQQTVLDDDGADPPVDVVERARSIFAPGEPAGERLSVAEHLGRIVAGLIFDSRAQPAPAGLRGQATSFQMTWRLSPESGEELDLHAEVTDTPGGEQWQLVGQVTGHDPIGPLTVRVCHAGGSAVVHSIDADERGSFVLRLDPGTYDLHLYLPDGLTVVPDLRLA